MVKSSLRNVEVREEGRGWKPSYHKKMEMPL